MALTKCKECGQQISRQAEVCPHCGFKSKRTSGVTWFIAIVLGVPFVIAMATSGRSTTSSSVTASAPTSAQPATPPPPTAWETLAASQDPADLKLTAEIRKMQWFDACRAWGNAARSPSTIKRADALRAWLLEDRTINAMDVSNVKNKEPAIGMTACGVYAVLGRPDDVNTTDTSRTTRQQLVYRSRGMYIYTDSKAGDHNGTVRTIQR